MSTRFKFYSLALLIGGILLAFFVLGKGPEKSHRHEGITKELVCTNTECNHVMPYDAAKVTAWHKGNFVKTDPNKQRSIFFECPECKKYTLTLKMHVPEHLEPGYQKETQ